jgi:phosphate transport system permease protein|tara:strand:+ start:1144 stop:2526 length:1383 start_codon:yes stop_codon:yes gene_type:complete
MMNALSILAVMLLLSLAGYLIGTRRALFIAGQGARLNSLPGYHGLYVALWMLVPALVVMTAWMLLEPQWADGILTDKLAAITQAMAPHEIKLLLSDIKAAARGDIASQELDAALQAMAADYAQWRQLSRLIMLTVLSLLVAAGFFVARQRISPDLRARSLVERVAKWIMILASAIAILTTVGIVFSLLLETLRFFGKVPLLDFLFGLKWSPQTALRSDQVGASGAFGMIPLFAGTLLITLIAMCVALPVGLFSAIYMSEYAGPRLRALVKPALEILAGIPTVVYGFFAALTVAPFFRDSGEALGLSVSSESALAAGAVMGIMIIPFISSLSDDVMNAVPQTLRDGSYALGATKSETILQVVIPAALPGIIGSVLLATSRAIGETMIVVMAAGLAANLTANPLNAVTTVTVQIVTLLVGDQEFDSAKTLAAFALGLMLFIITLCLNVLALKVVRKYREKYD